MFFLFFLFLNLYLLSEDRLIGNSKFPIGVNARVNVRMVASVRVLHSILAALLDGNVGCCSLDLLEPLA